MPLFPQPPSDAAPEERFFALREQLLKALIEPPKGFPVVVYALTISNDRVPSDTFARARSYALHRGWQVRSEMLWDGCGMTEPLERPEWRRVEALIAGGFVQGVVTVGQSAVSTSALEYEQVLERLASRRAFIAHVPVRWGMFRG
ncbi:hypothetical protein [Streptomyces inusitatus]|nr:hypothetical protein [Streptomyces inusitatus]